MAVYKEINRADGSGVTTFYRISDILDTAETDDQEGQAVIIDYNQAQNKPSINGVALVGNKTSEDLGLQPAGDYITNDEADEKFIDEDELEAKNYVNQAELQDAIAHIEHFHREIVEALPVTGMDNVLYMVRKGGTGEDIYNEYIWVGLSSSEDGYEFLGTTATDLTDYYKKSQVDAALATKVDKEGGKGLSEQNYTLAEKTKLAGLENYDDSELQADVAGLNTRVNNISTSSTALNNRVTALEPKVETNSAAVTTIYDLLDKKMTAIRLVEQGDGWVWMNLEGSRLTYAQASAALGHENCMLFIEQLENDGKVIPAEYKSEGDHINVIFKDLDSLIHVMTCGEDDALVTHDVTTTNGLTNFTIEDEAVGYTTEMTAIYGDTYQRTYTGKNLCPNNLTSGSQSGVTYQVNSDGSIKITGTATARVEPILFNTTSSNPLIFRAGRYKNTSSRMIVLYSNGYIGLAGGESRTLSEDTPVTQIYFRVENGESNLNETYYPQLVLEGQTDDYEPYVGGQMSPNLDYPQNIHVVKGNNKIIATKNQLLQDTNQGLNHWQNAPGNGTSTIAAKMFDEFNQEGIIFTKTVKSTNWQYLAFYDSNFKQLLYKSKQGTTFTISFDIRTDVTTNVGLNVQFKNGNGKYYLITFGSYTGGFVGNEWTHVKLTGQRNDEQTLDNQHLFIDTKGIQDTANSIEIVNLKIEYGSSETPWEPYEGQNLSLNLGSIELCKIGQYQDKIYKQDDTWYLHKEFGKVDLSTLQWQTFGTYARSTGLDGLIKYVPNNQTLGVCLAEKYNNHTGTGMSQSGDHTWIAVDVNAIATNPASGQSGLFYYQLATPTDTEITDQTLLAQLEALEQITQYKNTYITIYGADLTPEADFTYISDIVINNSDLVLGKDTYWNDEVPTSADLPANAQEGEIRIVQDTEAVYIYDGTNWIPFDKGTEVDLSNYLAKDNTTAWIPTGAFNPATKKYVDDSVGGIHIPTKTSQLQNDSNFINKNANDLTNYYLKTNTYTKAEVDALIQGGGGGIELVDNLNQTTAGKALDARQGNILSTRTVPSGGTTGQFLQKNSATDYDTTWTTLAGLPSGGTSGQVLIKNSATNYDAVWGSITIPNASSSTVGGIKYRYDNGTLYITTDGSTP